VTLEFYQQLHKTEFDRREALSGRSNGIMAGLTTLGGAVGLLLVGHKSQSEYANALFWIFLVLSVIAMASSAFYLIASYSLPPLEDIGGPTGWRTFMQQLVSKYAAEKGTSNSSAQAEFEEALIDRYTSATDSNIKSNTLRGNRLVKSNFAMLGAFVLVVLTAVVYYYSKQGQPDAIDAEKVSEMLANGQGLICVPTRADHKPVDEPKPTSPEAPKNRPVPGPPAPP
jgi:hypothetical protein